VTSGQAGVGYCLTSMMRHRTVRCADLVADHTRHVTVKCLLATDVPPKVVTPILLSDRRPCVLPPAPLGPGNRSQSRTDIQVP